MRRGTFMVERVSSDSVSAKITIKPETMARFMHLELALLTCCGYAFSEKVLHLLGQPLLPTVCGRFYRCWG